MRKIFFTFDGLKIPEYFLDDFKKVIISYVQNRAINNEAFNVADFNKYSIKNNLRQIIKIMCLMKSMHNEFDCKLKILQGEIRSARNEIRILREKSEKK